MSEQYLTHINEAMNALISANNIPGMKGTDNNSNSVYIVNYMQNNAFANGLTFDYKFRHGIVRDPDDKKLKMKDVDNQDEYGFDNSTDIKGVYRVLDKAGLSEGLEKIKANIGKEVDEGFIYECILGDKMYSWDQIEFSDKVEKVIPFDELIKGMNESIRNYTLYGRGKAELIHEIKYGNKSMNTLLSEYSNILLEKKSNFKIYYGLKEEEYPSNYICIFITDKNINKYTSNCHNNFLNNLKNDDKQLNQKTYLLVDTIKKVTIGYASLSQQELGVFIENIIIFDEYKGNKLSNLLLQFAIQHGANFLKVYSDNKAAIKIYKNFGFKIIDSEKDINGNTLYIMNYSKKLDSNEVIEESTNPSKEPTRLENLGGVLMGRVILDKDNKCFIIKGINFDKFLLRLKEMYQYKGILNLFEKKYSWWSNYLYEKNKIKKNEMKITNLSVNLFFALELYKIFLDLADFYKLPYYRHIAEAIYKKTWISNYEKKDYCKYTDTRNLNKFDYQLKDYQEEFVKNYSFLKSKYDLDGYILSFEQGLGKTLTATALAECLNKDQIIIVCPNSLRENWAYEITDYYKKYNKTKELSARDIYVYNSRIFTSKSPKFIIINQESIEKIYDIVNKRKNSMIIVDECHNFRNIDSIRCQNLLKLKEIANCKDNLMMSGTPIKATAEEIIPILRMIDPYFTEDLAVIYSKAFKNNTVQAADVIKERFGRILYRKTKEEVLRLPNKFLHDLLLEVKNPTIYSINYIRTQFDIEYKAEFDKRYPQFKKDAERYKELVNQYSSADRKLTKKYLEYIEEFANPFTPNGSQTEEDLTAEELVYKAFINNYILPNIKDEKTKKEVLELKSKYIYFKNSVMSTALGKVYPPARNNCYKELFDNNKSTIISMIKDNLKKTVIFTPFLEVAKHISEELNKDKINNVLIIGGTNNRMDLINKFKTSDDIDVLVATIQTLSTGITLTEADQMLFFGTPYRNADFVQACDRIHRIGQTRDVNIYIVKLKSKEKNITNRIDEILKWSDTSSSSLLESFEDLYS